MRRSKKPGSQAAMKIGKERYKKERAAHRAKLARKQEQEKEASE